MWANHSRRGSRLLFRPCTTFHTVTLWPGGNKGLFNLTPPTHRLVTPSFYGVSEHLISPCLQCSKSYLRVSWISWSCSKQESDQHYHTYCRFPHTQDNSCLPAKNAVSRFSTVFLAFRFLCCLLVSLTIFHSLFTSWSYDIPVATAQKEHLFSVWEWFYLT